jgi:hypothetical protein
MQIHAIHYCAEPEGEEVESIDYQCSRSCMVAELKKLGVHVEPGAAGVVNLTNGSVSFGGWPGGAETDYSVSCSHCDELLWHGLSESA